MTSNLIICSRLLITAHLFCLFIMSLCAGAVETKSPGMIAMNEGRYNDAYQYFSSQLSPPGNKNSALFYLAQLSLTKGDTGTAQQQIESALELLPNDSEEYRLAGDIYCNIGQQSSMFQALKLAKKCIASYETAIEKDSQNVKALGSATAFLYEAPGIAGGNRKKAEHYLTLLTQASPEHADTYKVNLYNRDGKSYEALTLAKSLVEKGIHGLENQYTIARFYRDSGNLTQAKPLFKSLAESQYGYDNRWYVIDSVLQVGEIYLREGKDINKSIEYIERYKAMNNNPQDTHYFWSSWSLAKAYFAGGNTQKFTELVNQIKSEKYKDNKPFLQQFEKELANYQ